MWGRSKRNLGGRIIRGTDVVRINRCNSRGKGFLEGRDKGAILVGVGDQTHWQRVSPVRKTEPFASRECNGSRGKSGGMWLSLALSYYCHCG